MSASNKESVIKESSRLKEKLPGMLKVFQKINSERDLDALLDLIAREATRITDADRASIFLLDKDKCELWSKVALGNKEILRFDARLGVAGAAAMTGQTINVKDAYEDPRFNSTIDSLTRYRTRSILAAPMRNYEGEIIGVFQLLNKKDGFFDNEDEEVLQALAAQAAVAIETAQLFQELRRHRNQLAEENVRLWKEVEGRVSTEAILGTSRKIQEIVNLIHRISDSTLNVLILGESGTGKELVAKAIHHNSPRIRHPFVAVNCAAIPESLVESELFGIERGVATGVEQRVGKFEAANEGTLFLDEIGDLSIIAQAKILRALEEGVIERVGGKRAIPVDVRILAATNRNLEEEIKRGNFREDLYYRLKVIQIKVPPLREIREDIPLLANHFLSTFCEEMKKGQHLLTPEALQCLMSYTWPGNTRELRNEMKRIAVVARRKLITTEDLSEAFGECAPTDFKRRSLKETVAEMVGQMEMKMIREALQVSHQNQRQAAKALGLSRQGLIKKMKRYGLTGQ